MVQVPTGIVEAVREATVKQMKESMEAHERLDREEEAQTLREEAGNKNSRLNKLPDDLMHRIIKKHMKGK